jgi:hypothetical protein
VIHSFSRQQSESLSLTHHSGSNECRQSFFGASHP